MPTKKGKPPVVTTEEAQLLLDSIDVTGPSGPRDRALLCHDALQLRAHLGRGPDERRRLLPQEQS
ncbi:MAG: hypothetical protein ACLQU2_23795 [Candidatus Binataceae bacterium]